MMPQFRYRISPSISAAAGGTRTRIKLDRPWQADIRIDSATCPFEVSGQDVLSTYVTNGNWRLLSNKHTPFPWHRLLVPDLCWPSAELRSLGGTEKIAAALKIIGNVAREHGGDELWLGVHVGPSAGQNIGHLHYHLLEPLARSAPTSDEGEGIRVDCGATELLILQEEWFRVIAGGCRTGQCFVMPNGFRSLTDGATVDRLAQTLNWIVSLYADRFRSKQGLPPDYMLAMKICQDARISYCTFIPILNAWGFTEYLGLLEGTPLILAWPHEETVEFLRRGTGRG